MSTLLDPASSLPTLVALLYPYTPNPSTFVSTALKVIGEASKKDLVDTFLSQDTLSCIYENVLSGAKKENIQECETQLANAVPNLVEREGGVLTGEDLKSAFAVVFGVLDGEATGEVAKRLGTGDEKSSSLRLSLLSTLYNLSPPSVRYLVIPSLLETFTHSAALQLSVSTESASVKSQTILKAAQNLAQAAETAAAQLTNTLEKRNIYHCAHRCFDKVVEGGDDVFLRSYLLTFSPTDDLTSQPVKDLALVAVQKTIEKRVQTGGGHKNNSDHIIFTTAPVKAMSTWCPDMLRLGHLFSPQDNEIDGGKAVLAEVEKVVEKGKKLFEANGIDCAAVVETGRLIAIQKLSLVGQHSQGGGELAYGDVKDTLSISGADSDALLEELIVQSISRSYLPPGARMDQMGKKVVFGTFVRRDDGAGNVFRGDWAGLLKRVETIGGAVKDVEKNFSNSQ